MKQRKATTVMNTQAAKRIQSTTAKANNGQVAANSFAARAQRAAKNNNKKGK